MSVLSLSVHEIRSTQIALQFPISLHCPSVLQAKHINNSTMTQTNDHINNSTMIQTNDSWQHDICSCGGCNVCMGAFFCSPCIHGRSAHRLQHYPNHPDSTAFSWFNGPCAIMCVATHFGFGWLPVWVQRSDIRTRLGIDGGFCTDCLASCCCTPCAVAQNEAELRDRAEKEALTTTVSQYNAQGVDGVPQYNQPGPMEYGAQKNF